MAMTTMACVFWACPLSFRSSLHFSCFWLCAWCSGASDQKRGGLHAALCQRPRGCAGHHLTESKGDGTARGRRGPADAADRSDPGPAQRTSGATWVAPWPKVSHDLRNILTSAQLVHGPDRNAMIPGAAHGAKTGEFDHAGGVLVRKHAGLWQAPKNRHPP